MRQALLAGMTFLLFSPSLMAETLVSVGTVGADVHSESSLPPDMLSGMVTSCLSNTPSVGVAERADIKALTREKSLSVAGVSHNGISALRLMPVHYVITGHIAGMGDNWLITLQANDPASTQMIAAHSTTLSPYFYRSPSQFCSGVVAPFIEKLLHHPALALPKAAVEETHGEASAWLLAGIASASSGDYAHAYAPLLKVLNQDPRNADACYWLAISYAGGELPDMAHEEALKCERLRPGHPMRQRLDEMLRSLQLPLKPATEP